MTILIPICNENPVKQNHICYFVKETELGKLILFQLRDVFYEHPDSTRMALIQNIECERVFESCPSFSEYSALQLLKYAQDNLKNVMNSGFK